jgi:hypothetical protein
MECVDIPSRDTVNAAAVMGAQGVGLGVAAIIIRAQEDDNNPICP